MTVRTEKRGFASRPGDAEGWIKAGETPPARSGDAAAFTARLTIDITPELRGRIDHEYFPAANHMFTERAAQAELLVAVTNWLARHYLRPLPALSAGSSSSSALR